jgi:hypothetical protein
MTISSNLIELGKSSTSAVISFCGGLGKLAYFAGQDQSIITGEHGVILSINSMLDAQDFDGCSIALYGTNISDSIASLMANTVSISSNYINVGATRASASVVASEISKTVLFSGDSNGTITLSDNLANYSRIRIYFHTDQYSAKSSIEVYSPNNSNVSMFTCTVASGSGWSAMVINGTVAWCSGTTISPSTYGQRRIFTTNTTDAGSDGNWISIYRVEGWK